MSSAKKQKVASPYSGNGFDQVVRVVDTIATMHRRHQINDRQLQAADRIREATDIIASSGLNGTLGSEGMGGGVGMGRVPAVDALWAADILAEVSTALGRVDGAIVAHVVGQGRDIEDTAMRVLGVADRGAREETGNRLRRSLTTLADQWFPRSTLSRIRVFRDADAKLTVGDSGTVERLPVAHADANGMRYSKRKA